MLDLGNSKSGDLECVRNLGGASGAYLKTLFEKLGVAEELKPKLKLLQGATGEAAANGEVEIGMTQISEILPYAKRRTCRAAAVRCSVLHLLLCRRVGVQQGSRCGQGIHQISRRAGRAGIYQGKGHGAGLIDRVQTRSATFLDLVANGAERKGSGHGQTDANDPLRKSPLVHTGGPICFDAQGMNYKSRGLL